MWMQTVIRSVYMASVFYTDYDALISINDIHDGYLYLVCLQLLMAEYYLLFYWVGYCFISAIIC